MPTAVLVDGAYFIRQFRKSYPDDAYDAERIADAIIRCAMSHLSEGKEQKSRELYRIFFYDCPPIEKKAHNPISKKSIDFSKSDEAKFRKALHDQLKAKRKVALRLGQLANDTPWTIKPDVIQLLLSGKKQFSDLTPEDVMPNVRQKGVDMRIGVDIASLSMKKQVRQIVLIAGDADFVPAAKMARREGIDFILDPMWMPIAPSLHEHIDGLRSTFRKPRKKRNGN